MLNASFLIAYLCIFLVSVSVSLFRSQEAKIKWASGAAIPFASNQNSLQLTEAVLLAASKCAMSDRHTYIMDYVQHMCGRIEIPSRG